MNKIQEIKKEIQLQFSKNGKFTSDILTFILKMKNLRNHYSIVKTNIEGRYINEYQSAYDSLEKLLKANPELESEFAMISDRKITYRELREEYTNLAKFLHYELKCKKGENISLCAESSVEGIVSFFALNKLGLVNARIFNGSKEDKMQKFITDFDSETIMTDDLNIEVLGNIAKNTRIKNVILMSACPQELVNSFKVKNPNINVYTWESVQKIGSQYIEDYSETVEPTDIASILYTSGSSGESKPISISNKVYTSMVDIVCNTTNTKKCDKEKVVGVVSHEYPYAAINSTIMIILLGKTLILPKRSEANDLDFNDLLAEKPDRIQAIPNFYKLLEEASTNGLLKSDEMSHFNSLISGGETYLLHEKKKLLKFLKTKKSSPLLIDGFGFGELGSATALKFGLNEYFLLMNGIEAKAVDPDTLEELPLDKEGVLCFTGPTIAEGYYNNPEATKKAFVKGKDGKKWFISDTYGLVHGRNRRLIKLGGRIREYFITSDGRGNFVKVYAGNVEDMIASTGIIKDCIVVPSDESGTPTPVAYIALRSDCNMDSEAIINLVKERCQNLENFAQPTEYYFEEEIGRTRAGKKDYTLYKSKAISNIK